VEVAVQFDEKAHGGILKRPTIERNAKKDLEHAVSMLKRAVETAPVLTNTKAR
jgi:hypothetical protein